MFCPNPRNRSLCASSGLTMRSQFHRLVKVRHAEPNPPTCAAFPSICFRTSACCPAQLYILPHYARPHIQWYVPRFTNRPCPLPPLLIPLLHTPSAILSALPFLYLSSTLSTWLLWSPPFPLTSIALFTAVSLPTFRHLDLGRTLRPIPSSAPRISVLCPL